jgi:hypothetical protein
MNIKGNIIRQSDIGFEKALMATMFNQVDPLRRPDLIVQPKIVEDIIQVIRLAKSTGQKISICSGGHSWSANHVRNNSILIDMSGFDKYEINPAAMTATAGPGVSGSDLLIDLFKRGLFFPSGHCKGVCLGGYLLQGGFAFNGRKLGMACESVLGLDIVTADGELVHASKDENADLYWAARGAGGGFFGVVVQYYLKLHKRPKYSGLMCHFFKMKHLEHVFNWAYEVGPRIPAAVEFQMLMSRKALGPFGSGIQAIAPVFAESKDELQHAVTFMKNSPIKNKAFVRMPFIQTGVKMMFDLVMLHYPDNHYWGVDNMWTGATATELLPYIKQIAQTLPPPPAHLLWLNWQPPAKRQDMAFSVEDKIYISLYGAWKSKTDADQHGNWATNWMHKMSHFSSGIQLADENLHNRPGRFLTDSHFQKLDSIHSIRDSNNVFNTWHNTTKTHIWKTFPDTIKALIPTST